MISKETLYRFLVELDSRYGNSTQYFIEHPYNEIQHKLSELDALRKEHSLCVCWDYMSPSEVVSYDVSDMFDISDRLSLAKDPDFLKLGVYSFSHQPRVSLTPDDGLFMKMAKLYIETDNYDSAMPTDVITIDDMSFTVHDILVAIEEHAEPHRLKRHMIIDRYVDFEKEDLLIKSTERYSDELIDQIERVAYKIIPYWNGTKSYDVTPSDGYVQWEHLLNGEQPELTEDNVLHLCKTIPDQSLNENIKGLKNIVDFMCDTEDKFIGIMLIRELTRAGIMISYNTVPRFKEFVTNNAFFVREIRYLE